MKNRNPLKANIFLKYLHKILTITMPEYLDNPPVLIDKKI